MNEDELLLEYDIAASKPGGTRLADWIERYPQHRKALVEYAYFSFVFEHGTPYRTPTPETGDRLLAAAQVVREQRMTEGPYAVRSPTDSPLKSLIRAAKERGLDVPAIAQRLRIGLSLVAKLDRRMIDPATIPQRVADALADLLGRTKWEVAAYLGQPTRLSTQASYQAKQAPQARSQQDFLEALGTCVEVKDEDKAYWREIAESEPRLAE